MATGGQIPLEQLFGAKVNPTQSALSITNPTQRLFDPLGNGNNITPANDPFKDVSFTSEVLNRGNDESTGLFNKVLNTFSIPQQVLYSIGKNIGEMFGGHFTGNFGDRPWYEELMDAAKGNSKLSFHDVMKTVGADRFDLALPDWLTLESPWVRIPAAIALGIGAAFLAFPTGGASLAAFAGFSTLFAGERILGGQGVISSGADVVLDPLNKLRVFQAAGKLDDAAKSKSILRQISEGDRRLFDLHGELLPKSIFTEKINNSGYIKRLDKVSEYMQTGTDFLHDTGIQAINKFVGQPVLKYVDPVTGYVHRNVGGLMKKLFVRNGDLAESVAKVARETKKLDNEGKILSEEDILKQEAEIAKVAEETRKVFSDAQDEAAKGINAEDRRIDKLLARKTKTEREAAVGEVERTAGNADPEELGVVDLTSDSVNKTFDDAPTYFARELQLDPSQEKLDEFLEFRDFTISLNEFTKDLYSATKKRDKVRKIVNGGDSSPERLQELKDLTLDVNLKQQQRNDVAKKLTEIEKKIKGRKDSIPAAARGVAIGEIKIMKKLLEGLFNEDSLNRLEIHFESTGGARDLINGTEEVIAATLLTKTAEANIGDTSRMILQIHRSATTHEAFNLITRVVYDNMGAAQKDQLLKMVQRTEPKIEAGGLRNWFIENMYKAGIHAVQRDDIAQRDFVSRMLDGIRMYWRKMKSVLFKSEFKDPKVYDWLVDFSHNIDHFSNIKKTGLADFSKFTKAETKGELYELLTNMWARMEQVDFLPKGSAYNVARNGAIWMPLIKKDNDSARKLRRAVFEPGIVSNSTISPHRSIGTISMQNIKETILEQEDFIVGNSILSKKEFSELKSVIEGADKNLNNLIKPGTVAGDLYEKLQRHMDLIPLEHFTMDEATIRWHVAQNHRNITARQMVDHIRDIGIRSEDSVEALKRSILNNIDRVWLDPEINHKAALILRNIEKNITSREGKESLDKVFELLNKPNLTIKGYAQIAHEMENIYPFISGLDAQKLKVFLPKAKDFENGTGFLNANRDGGVQSLGRLLSPELANAAIAAKVFKIDKVLDPKLFKAIGIKSKFTKKKVTLDRIFKDDEKIQHVFGDAKTFDDIFDTQFFKEIEEKGLGKTPIGNKSKADKKHLDELPVRKDLLEGSEFRSKEDVKKLVDSGEWVEFKPPSPKDGQLPPALQALSGLLVPKLLHDYLQPRKIDLPRSWEAARSALDVFLKGIESETAAKFTNKGAELIERVTGVKAPENLKNLSQSFFENFNFDYMTLLFKSQALMGFGFHTRNYISGMVVNFMHGMSGEAFVESFKDMYDMVRHGKRSVEFDEFRKQGLTGGGIRGELLQETGGGALFSERNSLNPFSVNDFVGYKFNFKFGGYVEDAIRYSSYKHARKSLGLSIEDASDFVKALHFDYNDLSNFERAFLKRLIPFYTYWRKAIVRDSRMFMERTGNMFKLTHLVQHVESGIEPEQEDSVAFWVKQRMGVPFRRNPETGAMEYFLLSNWIPAVELAEKFVGPVAEDNLLQGLGLPKPIINLAEQFLHQANPVLKIPLEQATNYNFYFGKKIEDYVAEESDFFGLSVPVKLIPLLRSIRFLNDLEKGITSVFGIENSTRPDIPRPPASQALFNVLTGGRVVSNDDPQKNIFINAVLPERELKTLLTQEIRRTGPDSDNAKQLFKLLKEAQERRVKAFQGFKPPQPRKTPSNDQDALKRLFQNPNPENL